MRTLLIWALPGLLHAQAPPLTYDDLRAKARTSPEQYRTEALLAANRRALSGTRGFLREGPSLSVAAGPRTNPVAPTSTDQTMELDLPLFLSRGTRRRLEEALGKADPVLREAARIEARFQLRKAYLDAWLAARALRVREADLETVQAWQAAARARVAAGADPAFQASLVEGEILRAQLDLDEARKEQALAWSRLRILADVPEGPVPLADPDGPRMPTLEGLEPRFERSALRVALQDRLELETRALRQQEALSTSRWSLRGSYGKENEDRITKVGVAYRFTRPGEGQAIRQEAEANVQVARREIGIALADLEARFQAAMARARNQAPLRPFTEFDRAIRAIGLRLSEGKERPSEALPIRRQLLEAQISSLRRIENAHLLTAELQALTDGVNP